MTALTTYTDNFKVLDGLTDISTGFGVVYSVASQTGCTVAINASTGLITVSAVTSDTASAVFNAVYNGVTIAKVWSVSKSRAGAGGVAGAPAKLLSVISDRQTIAYDSLGTASPTVQTTTFATNKQNTSATITWSITDSTGLARTPVTTFLSAGTGDVVTMTEAQFASARNGSSGVIVSGTLTDGTVLTDKVSVVRVQAGASGGSSFKLINIANCSMPTPNSITKISGSSWDGKVQTAEAYKGGATVSYDAIGDTGVGLTTDPAANISYDTVDYWFHSSSNGSCYVYRNGALIIDLGVYTANERFTVESNGATIRYYRNGSLVYSHPANNPNEVLYGVGNIATVGVTINNFAFGSAGNDGSDGSVSWTPVLSPNCMRVGSSFTSVMGATTWDSGFYSAEKFSQSFVSFKANATNQAVMVGLNSNPTSVFNYAQIDYAMYVNLSGMLERYENGTGTILSTAYTISDVLAVAHRDDTIVYLKNGSVLHTVTGVPRTISFAAQSSIYVEGHGINAVAFGVSGQSANTPATIYIRQYTPPSTPTGNDPAGWATAVPAGTETVWQSDGLKTSSGAIIGSWSMPVKISEGASRPYSAGTTYYSQNLVGFSGGTYAALQNSFAGQSPSGTAQDNSYWSVVAAGGSAGSPATPPSAPTATINLTSASGVNLRSIADANGYTGLSNANYTFNVPNGVVIRGIGSGSRGIDTGSWATSTYAISLTLVVQSGGVVDGGGGSGGTAPSASGGAGGDAIYCQAPITVTINAGGTVRGGGGGGGGAKDSKVTSGYPEPETYTYGGGGGGGGAPNGGGGGVNALADSLGSAGVAGTLSGGGTGGTPNGGAGGNFGVAGSNAAGAGGVGGAAGYAVRKNGLTVSVTSAGTMTGTAA